MQIFTNISIPELILLGLVGVLMLIIVGLLVVLLRSTNKTYELTYPIYEYIVKQAEHKAQKITHDAMERSRELLTDAEMQGTKVIAKGKIEHDRIEHEYEEKLNELMKHTESLFKTVTDKTQHQAEETNKLFEQYAEDAEKSVGETKRILTQYAKNTEQKLEDLAASMEKTVSADITKNEEIIKAGADTLIKQMQSSIVLLQDEYKKQIEEGLSKEFAAAKEVIETYRKQQMAFVDEYIVSLIERTATITLQKKLSLEDQANLVEQALEAAKSEGIFK